MDNLLEARQTRLGNNQSLFRSVNEEVELLTDGAALPGAATFFCECANPDCSSEIVLALDEYRSVRDHPKRFVVLPDHVFADVEVIVEDRGRYLIVEKFGAGGEVAASTDQRSND